MGVRVGHTGVMVSVRLLTVVGALSAIVVAGCSSNVKDSGALAVIPDMKPCTSKALTLGAMFRNFSDSDADVGNFVATELAVEDLNAAGGVNGSPVRLVVGGEGEFGSSVTAEEFDRLINEGAGAIIGPSTSAAAITMVDTAREREVVVMSPTATAASLSTYPDGGFFFRLTGSDVLQADVLTDIIRDSDHGKLAIIAREDPYGVGLERSLRRGFKAAGGEVVATVNYDPRTEDFTADVESVAEKSPDAIAILGFDETATIITALIDAGIGPQNVDTYLVDGNLSLTAFAELPEGTMTGVIATRSDPGDVDELFAERMMSKDDSLVDLSSEYATYDSVVLVALAAQAADCADGAHIAVALPQVANPNGEPCTSFEQCTQLLKEGQAIDYVGVSGSADLNPYGDLAAASMSVYEYTSNTTITRLSQETLVIPFD